MSRHHSSSATILCRSSSQNICLAILITLALLAYPGQSKSENDTIDVQILAINDIHGQLEPPASKMAVGYNETGALVFADLGGVQYLATHLKRLESENPNTILVSAGDSTGATPLISSISYDEPIIKALNIMGFELSAVGNHDLDKGLSELLRIQRGGCHPVDGCTGNTTYKGARFQYMAANMVNQSTNATIFPSYNVTYFQGVPVGFIGVTLEATPTVTMASSIKGLKFLDEAKAINECTGKLKEMGIRAIVVLVHDGGYQKGFYNESRSMSGHILDVVNATDKEVDAFITGHTHQAYNAVIGGRPVTQTGYAGRAFTDLDLVISRETGDVVGWKARNIAVTRDVPKDPEMTELINEYKALARPLACRVIGNITGDITKDDNGTGEIAIGDVIADGELYATSGSSGAVAAVMNSGGIRNSLVYNESDGELPGEVTFDEAFSILPFANNLVTMTLNGTQIDTMLEEQFDNPSKGANRILQVSEGVSYSWNKSAPTGMKVNISGIKINGTYIEPDGLYRITVPDFLADGGDNFAVLKSGINRTVGSLDIEAFISYFKAFSPVEPGHRDRITLIE